MVKRIEPVMTDRQSLTSQRGCEARTKRYWWQEGASNGNPSRSASHPVDSRHLPSRVLLKRNVETPYLRLPMASARSFLPAADRRHAARIVPVMGAPDLLSLIRGQSRSGGPGHPLRQADREESRWWCGTGCRKKRKPACNGSDTGRCPARKGAHVRQVLRRERVWRSDLTREGEWRP